MARSRIVVTVPASDATAASLLEAMAAGCVVVANDLPANREWLPPEALVPADPTPAEIAAALVRPHPPSSLDERWAFETTSCRTSFKGRCAADDSRRLSASAERRGGATRTVIQPATSPHTTRRSRNWSRAIRTTVCATISSACTPRNAP